MSDKSAFEAVRGIEKPDGMSVEVKVQRLKDLLEAAEPDQFIQILSWFTSLRASPPETAIPLLLAETERRLRLKTESGVAATA